MNALVCSGGSIKGAWQIGAVKGVIEKGYRPDFLYGISVGALNTTLINQEAGIQQKSIENLDWNTITRNCIAFWLRKVTEPSDIIYQRSTVKLIYDLLRNRFDGLTNNDALRKLVETNIFRYNLTRSPLKQWIGVTNFLTGDIEYIDPQSNLNFLDYVIASTSIPISMPAMIIKNEPYYDGGIRDIAPLKPAIQSGADTIVAILCQPKVLGKTNIDYRNAFNLAKRVIDIMTNEIENNDIDQMLEVNRQIEESTAKSGKKKINLIVIRPDQEIIVDILNFKSDDISRMIQNGYDTALNAYKIA